MKSVNKLSVIIISKNEEKHIGKLLDSIFSQDFPVPFEVILADNASRDSTVKIAKRYVTEIVKGGLQSAGRNAGARQATGNLLLFLDADTRLPEGFIRKNLHELTKKDLDVATPLTKVITKDKFHTTLCRLWNVWLTSTAGFLPHAGGYCMFSSLEVHQKIKGFNEKMIIYEDVNYVARASKHGKFGVLRSVPVITSLRRFRKDGTAYMLLRGMAFLFLKTLVGGEKANIFNYDFDYSKTRRTKPLLQRIKSLKRLIYLGSKAIDARKSSRE